MRVTIDVHDAIGTLIKLQDDFTSSDRELIAAEWQSLRFTCQGPISFNFLFHMKMKVVE